MSFLRHSSRSVFGVPFLIALVGCGGAERPDTVPVSGTVLYNGEPVAGATVSFRASGAPRAAWGVTDAQGRFERSTFGTGDGAVVGEHVVTVIKVDPASTADQPQDSMAALNDPAALVDMQRQAAGQSGPKSLLPKRYASPASSPLKETVTRDGPNSFTFALTD